MVGESLSDPTLNAFDIDNLVLNNNVEDHFSIKEDLKDNGDEDDGGGGDMNLTLIRERVGKRMEKLKGLSCDRDTCSTSPPK